MGVLQKCEFAMANNKRQINILTIERKAIDSVKSVIRLDNLSEYQIAALSNLLRVEVTNNDCFISRPTGSEKSAVVYISLYFLSLYMKRFSYLYRMMCT
jgi:hypothetical protein